MLVGDTLYRLAPAMDEWLPALRRQLRTRGEGAPADVLGPRSALAELDTVCASMREGRGGPNKGNRPSLQRDLSRALGSLGPDTQAACAPHLRDFRSELASSLNAWRRLRARASSPSLPGVYASSSNDPRYAWRHGATL